MAAGDELEVAIHAAGNGAVWRWQVTHRSGSRVGRGGTADQSTFFGSLMSPAALRRTAGDHRPGLGEEGEIDALVLERMRRGESIDAMAQHLARRFPRRFPTLAGSRRRVRELARRYGT